jgi:predicted DNA-binding transcriptional regulator YafY
MFKQILYDFVLKRATLTGKVLRSDIIDAFPGQISTSTATAELRAAVSAYPEYLIYSQRAVRLRPGAETASLNESALIRDFVCSDSYAKTGAKDTEIDVTIVQWSNPLPHRPGPLRDLLCALAQGQQLEILYVGMRINEMRRWRWIHPLGLERVGDQWRLIAHDLDEKERSVKTFVLARIMDARRPGKRQPSGFQPLSTLDDTISLRVRINPRMTEDQQKVIAHELGIKKGNIRIPRRSLGDFIQRYAGETGREGIVWPPIFVEEQKI